MPSVRERMPDLGPLGAVIDRCLIKHPAHRTPDARVLLAELEALAPGRHSLAIGENGSPFAGLAAFQEVDADRFFGRDRDIEQIITELRSRPLVAVVGASGVGKSSLVRAGVIPALKRSGEGWDACVVRPGRSPLAVLAGVLAHLSGTARTTSDDAPEPAQPALVDSASNMILAPIIERLCTEPGYLGARLRAHASSKLRHILVFVDQFEELYTLGVPADERSAFLACLAAVADDAVSPLRVILSMRSDFLDRLTEDRHLSAEVTRGLLLLPAMDREGLREALMRPLKSREFRFESLALVERMVDALDATSGALPLLQFTAARLWDLRDTGRRMLTEASYEKLGGVAGALASHADAVLASMPVQDARLARTLFLRLVTPERTRALATMAELRQLGDDFEAMDRVLARLMDARLLSVGGSAGSAADGGGSDAMVEIIHESLINTWPLLGQWLVESEEDAIFLTRLRSAARDWERGGHAQGLLWTGEAAGEARAWHQRYQGELAPGEERYLAAVVVGAERQRRLRRQMFSGLFALLAAVAVALGYLAWQEGKARAVASQSATQAREEAARAAQETMRARDATRLAIARTLPRDPTTQLALLREIEDTASPPAGTAQELWRLIHAPVAHLILEGHTSTVSEVAFSPDGSRIISASQDHTVRVWNANGSGTPLILRGHDGPVTSALISPDGTRIVSASRDKTIRVWNADGSGSPLVLRGHQDKCRSVAFSPSGSRIASASDDRTVRVWNSDGSGTPLVLRGHEGPVNSVAFSPDGSRITSASDDRTVRVWNADGSGAPLVLRGHEYMVSSAAFSPDGSRIASASADGTVRVWNSDGAGSPLVLRGHYGAVWSAAFSPDSSRIVSGSDDKTVRVWNSNGSGSPLVFHGHRDWVVFVAFSPDGSRIASASSDTTVRVWSLKQPGTHLVLFDQDVGSAAFSPDGSRIVSASLDRTVRVWNADGSGTPRVLRGHNDRVTSTAFSPDGSRIVSASVDRTVRVWSSQDSDSHLVFRGHNDHVTSAAFSPDGSRIVSASHDSTVRVWNADGSGTPLVLRGHEDPVYSAEFNPDGSRIVSASHDGTVRVWNADGSGTPLVLRGHERWTFSAAFSPDGSRIVSASADGTVRVWNANGSGSPLVFRGHDDWVMSAAFSRDGTRIVSASQDGTIRIWNSDGTGEPVILTGHSSRVESARFSPNGQRIVSSSFDGTIRIWDDLTPATLDDPRLWTATTFCMPIQRRKELLSVTEGQARRDRQRCLERVEQARHSAMLGP